LIGQGEHFGNAKVIEHRCVIAVQEVANGRLCDRHAQALSTLENQIYGGLASARVQAALPAVSDPMRLDTERHSSRAHNGAHGLMRYRRRFGLAGQAQLAAGDALALAPLDCRAPA
jgi:hypothetical protein